MSIEGLIIGLVFVAVTGLWVAFPWLERRPSSAEDVLLEKQEEYLRVPYERVLGNIRDLDEDHSTGKIGSDDYEVERETWVQRGIQILRMMDEQGAIEVDTAGGEAVDDAIEAAIDAYRSKIDK